VTGTKVALMMMALPAFAGPWDNYNPFPELPYEATTVAQDELVDIIKGNSEDRSKESKLAASKRLAEDPAAPEELVRWAVFKMVEIYSFGSQPGLAVEVGRAWLAKHPDHPEALSLRLVLAQNFSMRGGGGFKPTPAEVIAAYDDIFKNHDPQDWRVIEARVGLARRLFDFGQLYPEKGRTYAKRREQEIAAATKSVMDKIATAGPAERAQYLDYLKYNVDPLQFRQFMVGSPPSAADEAAGRQGFIESLRNQGYPEEAIQEFIKYQDAGRAQTTPPTPDAP
jgi:hypothetical protein